ncbi:MAG: glycogen/starch synthase [Prevotellaceae bacterium]|jgi:glycosyltransferase involved in cell wall biosynthesis|nr:glycogen/starch synthase [Prevotellaceae bacterium]
MLKSNYVFESSWEVCNKVGGIYTVLSSKASTMRKNFGDNVFFIGPDIWQNADSLDFTQTNEFAEWRNFVNTEGKITVKIGRWKVPGEPLAILVDFRKLFEQKNEIFYDFWAKFGVNSLNAYGDYNEAGMFGVASGMVIESFYNFYKLENQRVIAHFEEWTTSFGLFYIKSHLPEIATVFTTHATTIGRSIAGNHKPLYDYLQFYNGDQMSRELNVEAKHSAEKTAAHLADCFTTVSNITACECASLLEKMPEVTPNGFEDDFVPKGAKYPVARKKARQTLLKTATEMLGYKMPENTVIIGTSGRYEFKNKGLDVFIDAINVAARQKLDNEILVFIMVPAWINPYSDEQQKFATTPLMEQHNDMIINALNMHGFSNSQHENIKIIFAPVYLNGQDGRFNLPYYDLLSGFDLTVFPSYYEPWGYTPMESAAFAVPTITTNLAGFGQWISPKEQGIDNGVAVIERNDHNYFDVMHKIADEILKFVQKSPDERKKIAKLAQNITKNAHWNKFFEYYKKAYEKALKLKIMN